MRNKLTVLAAFLVVISFGQEPANDWYFNDFNKKSLSGIGMSQALELAKGMEQQEIIVAVIDAGVDVYHPDLQGQLWINEDEIAGNNIDDDGNGYIDDIYGWNFIGGKDTSIGYDNMELTRQYAILKEKYSLSSASSVDDEEEYQYYLELKKKYKEARDEAKSLFEFFKQIQLGMNTLEDDYGTDISMAELQIHQSSSRNEEIAKLMLVAGAFGDKDDFVYEDAREEFDDTYDHYYYEFHYGYNTSYDPRHIVGDDYDNSDERYYGNNVVYFGEDFSSHGTHVAGIIAANRLNDTGAMGVCQSARIMSLRAVPNGDERDKDVANSIYYAVDNGAKIINMSFGKGYVHDSEVVKKAIAYAKEHGVLLVHGAGNDAESNDLTENYPNDFDGTFESIWIEVGASSWEKSPKMLATFSNYGQTEIDVFAPGVSIYSTYPENEYEAIDGTSMASPVVAGVAAFVWSYYPEFTAEEIRSIVLESAIELKCKQRIPGSKKKSKVSKLSVTGSMVNVGAAMQLAAERSKS
ncbi:MAG: S8 family serine peptidase [Bacteroidia bacterium]